MGRLAPYFITGCPKSGTTLAVHLLNNHPDFNLDYEVHAAVGLAHYHAMMPSSAWVRWMRTDKYTAQVYDRLVPTGKFDDIISRAIGELHSGWESGKHWGSGTKALIFYYDSILQMFPQATFLMVLRDPRDVFCSLRATGWRQQWSSITSEFIKHYNTFLPYLDRVPHVRYEDIIQDPTVIYSRLGLQPPDNVLHGVGSVYAHRTQPKEQAILASGTVPDVLYNRVARWKTDLDARTATEIVKGCAEVFDRGFYLPS